MNLNNKKLLVMAGGTGGHVFPGLACANAWRSAGGDVHWMGTQAGIEADLVPKADIPISYIHIQGVRGKGKLGLLAAPFKIVRAIVEALAILRQQKPQVILGMGGFAAGPGGVAAKLLGIPVVIHEQNAIAGTTNTLLSKIAKKVLQAFPNTFAQGETVGNPIRPEILALRDQAMDQERKDKDLRVLIIGGSLGALAINNLMPEVYAKLKGRIQLCHQTGKRHIDKVVDSYGGKTAVDKDDKLELVAFIDDMAERLKWADYIICRSGAMTVSELAAAHKPALFIPFPYAIDDHQSANAKWMASAGAADVIQERDLDAGQLVNMIEDYVENSEKLNAMRKQAAEIAIYDATERVVSCCAELSE